MVHQLFKVAGLALALTVAAPTTFAVASNASTAFALPSANQAAPSPAPVQETIDSQTETPSPVPEVVTPPIESAPQAAPSNRLAWIALGLAALSLLAVVAITIIIFITERNRDKTFDTYDASFDSNHRQIDNLKQSVSALNQELSQTRSNLAQAVAALDERRMSGSHSRFVSRTVQPATPTAPQPAGASEQEIDDLLIAYREILQARDPEPLNRFIATYHPSNVAVSDDRIVESRDAEATVWLITRPHWSGEGILLPGDYAIRNWATTFQPSSGLRAEKLFGVLYWVEKGNLLEISSPCRIQISDHGSISILQKGTLIGA